MRRRSGTGLGTAVGLLACASLAAAAVVQQGNLRITVLSQVLPYKLPRQGTAPIAVFVSGHLEAPKGGSPRPAAEADRRGQPPRPPAVQGPADLPASQRSSPPQPKGRCQLRRRPDRLGPVLGPHRLARPGRLPDPRAAPDLQRPRERQARPLHPHLHLQPLLQLLRLRLHDQEGPKGAYGTELSASLPEALGSWGYVDRIKLTLKRKYTYKGKQLSYFNAGCPAPKGAKRTVFPLALATFDFAEDVSIAAKVEKACAVKE